MGHYAIRNKSRIFRLFDEGKRPADIDDASVSRTTLYQYYAEWRRERGIKGKETGFAVKKYIRNGNTSGNPQKISRENVTSTGEDTEVETSERKKLDNFILDCYAIIDALKRGRQGNIFLHGSQKQRPLAEILFELKYRKTGKGTFLSQEEYLNIFNRWAEIAKKARNTEEFYRLSEENGISLQAPGL